MESLQQNPDLDHLSEGNDSDYCLRFNLNSGTIELFLQNYITLTDEKLKY